MNFEIIFFFHLSRQSWHMILSWWWSLPVCDWYQAVMPCGDSAHVRFNCDGKWSRRRSLTEGSPRPSRLGNGGEVNQLLQDTQQQCILAQLYGRSHRTLRDTWMWNLPESFRAKIFIGAQGTSQPRSQANWIKEDVKMDGATSWQTSK